ncbi:hypothetical protein CEXT_315191 [Caerostris extrusa]|uniref:Transposase n=1 Tax=Caerostris extrusa TaxID=172846 RepID=A0AAV4M8X5_CAEEX|nr:hypothetical protein CEXT_315191 [Caerostris extrusa]
MPGNHTCIINGQQMRQFKKNRNVVSRKGTIKTPKIKKGWGRDGTFHSGLFINFKVVSFYRLFAAVGDTFNAFCDLASSWPGKIGRGPEIFSLLALPEDTIIGD